MEKYLFLDANIYIDARYSFENPRMKKLSKYIYREGVNLLECSTLVGEVEKHIRSDLGSAISELNKVLKMKEFAPVRYETAYKGKLEKLDENEVIDLVISKFDDFLDQNNRRKFLLDGISVEEVMRDYFQMNPPFEMSKPKEFKDAIMIKALKQFQQELDEKIVVISKDIGFCEAFKNCDDFIVFEKLDDYFKYIQDDAIYTMLQKSFENDVDYDEIVEELSELVKDFNFYFDEREEFEVLATKIDNISYDFDYSEVEDDHTIKVYITAYFSLVLQCKYLDISNSYYDREDDEYIVKSYIESKEIHHFEHEIILEYLYEQLEDEDTENEEKVKLSFSCINTEMYGMYIDLTSDNTLWECIDEKSFMSDKDKKWYENNVVKCIECGRVLGFSDNWNFHDYNGEPLCKDCAVTNERGFICSICGYKHPYNCMGNSGQYCIDCEEEYDK